MQTVQLDQFDKSNKQTLQEFQEPLQSLVLYTIPEQNGQLMIINDAWHKQIGCKSLQKLSDGPAKPLDTGLMYNGSHRQKVSPIPVNAQARLTLSVFINWSFGRQVAIHIANVTFCCLHGFTQDWLQFQRLRSLENTICFLVVYDLIQP